MKTRPLTYLRHLETMTGGFPRARWYRLNGFIRGSAFVACLALSFPLASAEEGAAQPAPEAKAQVGNQSVAAAAKRKQVALPGISIDAEKYCVDVDATICLNEGALELIACTKGTKEHESILVIGAKAMHIHAALLLIGARPGNPAMRKPVGEDGMRWIDIPPKGDAIGVSLVFPDKDGKMTEHPISDFVKKVDEEIVVPQERGKAEEKFPDSFLFAGSILHGEGKGEKQYLSDVAGDVISISTFGDELLCLSEVHAQDNGSLTWQANPDKLPELGTKVILRLRPLVHRAPLMPKPQNPPSGAPPEAGKQ